MKKKSYHTLNTLIVVNICCKNRHYLVPKKIYWWGNIDASKEKAIQTPPLMNGNTRETLTEQPCVLYYFFFILIGESAMFHFKKIKLFFEKKDFLYNTHEKCSWMNSSSIKIIILNNHWTPKVGFSPQLMYHS